jgi:3-dehydroquinate dehydratase II
MILHGPNLNQLGKRDPKLYGTMTQDQLFEFICNTFEMHEFTLFQSNAEHELIDVIHHLEDIDALMINLGAFTHYSYAIRDALELTKVPMVDVHLSDLKLREPFRQINVLEGITLHTFMGKKEKSYEEAVRFLMTLS